MTLTSTRTRFAPVRNVGRCSCGGGVEGACARSATTHVRAAAASVRLASASNAALATPFTIDRCEGASHVECGQDRRMIARSDIALHDTAADAVEHRTAGE